MTIPPTHPALIQVRGLSKRFRDRAGADVSSQVVAAERVSFELDRGEAIALVGESGSGKSTLARLLLRLEVPDEGEILLEGKKVAVREPRVASLAYRRRVQMVFQDPFGSLNPVHTVFHHLERPILRHGRVPKSRTREAAQQLLVTVGLEPPEEFLHRHPHALSGGQRQRVAIARALAVDPDVLVADEPTSMLDGSIRIGILNLLARLKEERQLAVLLITHDLASARYLAERILVLYRGRVVEDGPTEELLAEPAHPYTRALLAATADATEQEADQPRTHGTELTPGALEGCPYLRRCPEARDLCQMIDPEPRLVEGRRVRCHLYPENPHGERTSPA